MACEILHIDQWIEVSETAEADTVLRRYEEITSGLGISNWITLTYIDFKTPFSRIREPIGDLFIALADLRGVRETFKETK